MIHDPNKIINKKPKKDLEDVFSAFIKDIMKKEMATLKSDLTRNVKNLRHETNELTRSIAEELAGISNDTHHQIEAIEEKMSIMRDNYLKSLNGLSEIFYNQVQELESSIKDEIKLTSNTLYKNMSAQVNKLNISMIKLSDRVHKNEETLHNTRDGHGEITSLLHDFAEQISSTAPKKESKPERQKAAIENSASPFVALEESEKQGSQINAS